VPRHGAARRRLPVDVLASTDDPATRGRVSSEGGQ